MENPKATSGYNCVKDHPGFKGCWSTEGACPKCPQIEEVQLIALLIEYVKWLRLLFEKIEIDGILRIWELRGVF